MQTIRERFIDLAPALDGDPAYAALLDDACHQILDAEQNGEDPDQLSERLILSFSAGAEGRLVAARLAGLRAFLFFGGCGTSPVTDRVAERVAEESTRG